MKFQLLLPLFLAVLPSPYQSKPFIRIPFPPIRLPNPIDFVKDRVEDVKNAIEDTRDFVEDRVDEAKNAVNNHVIKPISDTVEFAVDTAVDITGVDDIDDAVQQFVDTLLMQDNGKREICPVDNNPLDPRRRNCENVDGSFKAQPTGQKLFSTRGNLDHKHEKSDFSNSDMDLIIKMAEMQLMMDEGGMLFLNLMQARHLPMLENIHVINRTVNAERNSILKPLEWIDENLSENFYNTFGFVARLNLEIGQVCVVNIRGSMNNHDWLANFNFVEKDILNLETNGYYKPFYRKAKLVENDVLNATKGCNHVVFSGHSLGGGVASILGVELSETLKSRPSTETVNLVLFASPRPGKNEIAEKAARVIDSIFSFTNTADPVFTVAPQTWGFRHLVYPSMIRGSTGPIKRLRLTKALGTEMNALMNVANIFTGVNNEVGGVIGIGGHHDMEKKYFGRLRQIFYEQDARSDMK